MFLVCFSLVNRDSYENVQNKWMQEIRWVKLCRNSFISSTERQLQKYFYYLFLQMTYFEKNVHYLLLPNQILTKHVSLYQKKQVSSKNLYISSSKKDNTLRIQRQSSLWEQKWTSGFESKSFGAVK